MAAVRRSNPLALAVLACLHERPMHPYEVAQTLRFRAKHESVKLNYGSLYSVVESLEKRSLIRATQTVRDSRRPERTVYEITDAGRREFEDWLTELLARPAKEYLQFEAALSFIAGLTPEDALAALQERCTVLQFSMTAMRAVLKEMEAAGLPRLHGLEVEYMITLYEAELDWVRRLVKDLDGGSLDGLDEWEEWHGRHGEPRSPPDLPLPDLPLPDLPLPGLPLADDFAPDPSSKQAGEAAYVQQAPPGAARTGARTSAQGGRTS